MSSYGRSRTSAVLATGTMVRQKIPGTLGLWVAAVTPGPGQVRAVAIADLGLPLRIWSASRRSQGTTGVVEIRPRRARNGQSFLRVLYQRASAGQQASQNSGMLAVNL